MPGGGKGKGGSSSTVTVKTEPIDVDSTVTVEGLDDIGLTLQGGDQPVKSEARQDLTVGGGDKPVKSESTQTQDLTVGGGDKPVETRSRLDSDSSNRIAVDVKPLAVDLCTTTTVNAGKLPEGVVRQPYHTHFGITWFGIEFLGFSLSGESKTVYDDGRRKPSFEWPAQQSAPAKDRGEFPKKDRGGLRVRIK